MKEVACLYSISDLMSGFMLQSIRYLPEGKREKCEELALRRAFVPSHFDILSSAEPGCDKGMRQPRQPSAPLCQHRTTWSPPTVVCFSKRTDVGNPCGSKLLPSELMPKPPARAHTHTHTQTGSRARHDAKHSSQFKTTSLHSFDLLPNANSATSAPRTSYSKESA